MNWRLGHYSWAIALDFGLNSLPYLHSVNGNVCGHFKAQTHLGTRDPKYGDNAFPIRGAGPADHDRFLNPP